MTSAFPSVPSNSIRVSIVIPTYNRADLLQETLESALAQNYPDLEIIVSDNASTDGTQELMARYADEPRIRYHRNATNLGMVGNWRQAVREHVTGDFFIILSDDDYFEDSDYISKAVGLIHRCPDIVLVYANGYILNAQTGQRKELRLPFEEIEAGPHIFSMRDRVRPQDFTLCNVLFQTKPAIALDAFSDPLNLACDSELFLNLCLFGKVGIIKDFASVYRFHDSNLINTVKADPALLIHAFDMYTKPYKRAIAMGVLSCEEQASFEQALCRALRKRLIDLYKISPCHYRLFLQSMKEQLPELARKARRHPKTLRKLFTCWCMRAFAKS